MKIALIIGMSLMGLLLGNPSHANEETHAGEHTMHEQGGEGMSSQHTANSKAFDHGMMSILSEYLTIQTALAGDEIEGIHRSAAAIEEVAKTLDPKTAPAEHAAHYENIPADLVSAAAQMSKADGIDEVRAAFKELSKPIAMWVTMRKPEGMSVMYCPMENAGWVQGGEEVTNPYLGEKQLLCGMKMGVEDDSSHGDHSSDMQGNGSSDMQGAGHSHDG